MKAKILGASILALAATFGCGTSDGSGGSAGSDADGTWSSPCVADGKGEYYKETYVIGAAVATQTMGLYSDANCTTATSLTAYNNTFTTGNAVSSPAGAKEVTTKLITITMTFKTDDKVSSANMFKFCNAQFVKDEAKVLDSTACKDDFLYKDAFNDTFTIYKVDGTKLYLGECGDDGTSTDCTAAAKRASALSDAYYTKS